MNVVVNDTHLYNIADAIRAKGGTADKLLISEMPSAIDNLTVANKSYEVTGDCSNKFASLTNVFPTFGDYVNWNCHDITNTNSMFSSSDIEKIPFELHFIEDNNNIELTAMFQNCYELRETPVFKNECKTNCAKWMFRNCHKLKEITEDSIKLKIDGPIDLGDIFAFCYSLRSFPMDWFEPNYPGQAPGYYTRVNFDTVYGAFRDCMALDELVDLPLPYVNQLVGIQGNGGLDFTNCCRLARLKFKDTGSYRFTNATINLSTVGFATTSNYNLFIDDGEGNSGITSDKRVNSTDTYNSLKNDPDWFATSYQYSRYNKISALETINSLPDMNYMNTGYGGTSTIKFKGAAGLFTDGGAINTMTEEEIAVATAKGWTVTMV